MAALDALQSGPQALSPNFLGGLLGAEQQALVVMQLSTQAMHQQFGTDEEKGGFLWRLLRSPKGNGIRFDSLAEVLRALGLGDAVREEFIGFREWESFPKYCPILVRVVFDGVCRAAELRRAQETLVSADGRLGQLRLRVGGARDEATRAAEDVLKEKALLQDWTTKVRQAEEERRDAEEALNAVKSEKAVGLQKCEAGDAEVELIKGRLRDMVPRRFEAEGAKAQAKAKLDAQLLLTRAAESTFEEAARAFEAARANLEAQRATEGTLRAEAVRTQKSHYDVCTAQGALEQNKGRCAEAVSLPRKEQLTYEAQEHAGNELRGRVGRLHAGLQVSTAVQDLVARALSNEVQKRELTKHAQLLMPTARSASPQPSEGAADEMALQQHWADPATSAGSSSSREISSSSDRLSVRVSADRAPVPVSVPPPSAWSPDAPQQVLPAGGSGDEGDDGGSPAARTDGCLSGSPGPASAPVGPSASQ